MPTTITIHPDGRREIHDYSSDVSMGILCARLGGYGRQLHGPEIRGALQATKIVATDDIRDCSAWVLDPEPRDQFNRMAYTLCDMVPGIYDGHMVHGPMVIVLGSRSF